MPPRSTKAASASASAAGKRPMVPPAKEPPAQEPATIQPQSKFMKRSDHGQVAAAADKRLFSIRIHECVHQQSTEHGEKGTPTGNWILAVKTPIGPKEYYTKYSDKFKVDSDTVRLNADIQCAFAT